MTLNYSFIKLSRFSIIFSIAFFGIVLKRSITDALPGEKLLFSDADENDDNFDDAILVSTKYPSIVPSELPTGSPTYIYFYEDDISTTDKPTTYPVTNPSSDATPGSFAFSKQESNFVGTASNKGSFAFSEEEWKANTDSNTFDSSQPQEESEATSSGKSTNILVTTNTPTGLPTSIPTGVPSAAPTIKITSGPSGAPTRSPTDTPTGNPSSAPSSSSPTGSPTGLPSSSYSSLVNFPILFISGPLYFDGTQSYYYETIAFGLSDTITLSLWIETSKYDTVIMNLNRNISDSSSATEGSFEFSINSQGNLEYTDSSTSSSNRRKLSDVDTVTSTESIAMNNRTHIAFVKNGKTQMGVFYINGEPSGTVTNLFDILFSNHNFYLGYDYWNESRYFIGTMDNIRLYRYALNEKDVKNLMLLTPVPSAVPTSVPTSIPTSAPTLAPICIRIALSDTFGDGWGSSTTFFAYPSDGGDAMMHYVKCGNATIDFKYCFNPEVQDDGDYVVLGVIGYNPTETWEIFWQVLNGYDGKLYSGGYDTSMTFRLHKKYDTVAWSGSSTPTISVTLDGSINLLPNEYQCQSCIDYTPPTPPPLPPNSGPKGIPPPKNIISPPKPKPLTYSLTGFNGSNWFSPDGYGTNFYISDYYGNSLEYSGTSCHESGCPIILKDGSYMWRVTGFLYEYMDGIHWEFCDQTGGSSNEMKFIVKNGKCIAVELNVLEELCAQEQLTTSETMVTLKGSLQLNGAGVGETPDEVTKNILQHVVSQEFKDSRLGLGINVISDEVKVDVTHTVTSTRSLLEVDSQVVRASTVVTFTVNLKTAAYGINAESEEEVSTMVTHLKTYLRKSMSSGIFIARVVARAKSKRVVGLQSLVKVELMDLNVVHKSETLKEKSFENISSVVVGVGSISGLLFGALLLMYFRKRQLRNDHANFNVNIKSSDSSINLVTVHDLIDSIPLSNIHNSFPISETCERGDGGIQL